SVGQGAAENRQADARNAPGAAAIQGRVTLRLRRLVDLRQPRSCLRRTLPGDARQCAPAVRCRPAQARATALSVLREKLLDPAWQPCQLAASRAAGKAGMTAAAWIVQQYVIAGLVRSGQAGFGNKGIIACYQ